MAKSTSVSTKLIKSKKRKTGVHAKSKTSKIKTSKNYRKKSVGQG